MEGFGRLQSATEQAPTSLESKPPLGLIAGNRRFPIYVARAAKARGHRVIAVGLKEETDPALEREVDEMHWISFSEIGTIPQIFKQASVRQLLLAGQVRPERLLQAEDRLGDIVRNLIRLLPDRSGSSALRAAVQYLEFQGFRVLHSDTFLKEWVPQPGLLTQRAPDERERQDIAYGLTLARQLAQWGVGQTVVVHSKAVVAVEAMEGTDAAIRRAGQLVGKGCVVVKACETGHDMRFDIPVVGLETLQAMEEVGATALGIEAGRCLLFDLPACVDQANRAGIACWAS